MKGIRAAEKNLILTVLAALFVFMAPAVCSYAEEKATPLYSFEYQGSKIDTYATYSEVDGVKTEGFRYFVKDGNLLAVDNRLNSAADGIFIHYADGDSYIGVLTRGGRLVSLGTVDLSSALKNFRNSGITDIVSNVKDDSRNLIVSYANGGLVGYDVVTGEELFRRGGTEAEKSLTDYIAEYLSNMVESTKTTTNTTARTEADKIAAIMENKGYTLEELAAGGVFSSTDSLNSFVQNGVLNKSVDPDAAGGTGTGEMNASRPGAEALEEGGESIASGTNTETAAAEETADTVRKEETGESKGSTTDVKSSEVLKKKSAAEAKESAAEKTQVSSAGENGEAEIKPEEKSSSKEESKTAAAKNVKTGTGKVGSAVIQKKESGTGTASGKTTDGSNKEAGMENGAGEVTGTEGKGGRTGKESGEKNSENAASKNAASKNAASKNDASKNDASENNASEGTSEKDSKDVSGKKKLLAEKNGYVPVFNPDTGSYEIYSVSELLENPENPKSENAKLDNADNRAIASLLKVKEDENNERGISLYTVVIIAVVGLMLLAVLFIAKQSRREAKQEAEQGAKKQQSRGGEAAV